jgi:hypothetical protein
VFAAILIDLNIGDAEMSEQGVEEIHFVNAFAKQQLGF